MPNLVTTIQQKEDVVMGDWYSTVTALYVWMNEWMNECPQFSQLQKAVFSSPDEGQKIWCILDGAHPLSLLGSILYIYFWIGLAS
jgi:hypothetical protein